MPVSTPILALCAALSAKTTTTAEEPMDLSQFDYSAAKFWMGVLQLLGLAALAVYTHVTNKS